MGSAIECDLYNAPFQETCKGRDFWQAQCARLKTTEDQLDFLSSPHQRITTFISVEVNRS